MLGQLGLGVLELAELLLPAVLEAAGDQAVVGLAGVEGALGTDRLIAGALDAALERPVGARPAVGVLVGGGERERDLLGRERLEQPLADELIDRGHHDRPAASGLDPVNPRASAVVAGTFLVVMGGHQPSAAPAAHDPLAQRAAFAWRALTGARTGWRQAAARLRGTAPSRLVARMMVLDHDRPLRAWQPVSLGHDRAIGPDQRGRRERQRPNT